MPHKVGLNKKEQIQCAKWLEEGIDPKLVAKKFKTSVEVVGRFTQEKLDEAKDKADKRAGKMNKVVQQQRKKAKILTDAIEVTKEDFI